MFCTDSCIRLVRSILFPKPANFKLYADSFKFVAVMAFMATLGFAFSVTTFIKYNVEVSEIILNACDVVGLASLCYFVLKLFEVCPCGGIHGDTGLGLHYHDTDQVHYRAVGDQFG